MLSIFNAQAANSNKYQKILQTVKVITLCVWGEAHGRIGAQIRFCIFWAERGRGARKHGRTGVQIVFSIFGFNPGRGWGWGVWAHGNAK